MKQEELKDQAELIEKDTTNLTRYWAQRDVQMALDRDIINLVKPEAKTDEIRWIYNEPKVSFDTAQSLISLFPPRFRLPLDINYKPEEKDKMNKAERLCIGIHRTLDARQADVGSNTWLRDLAYFVLLGWYATFVWVTKRGEEVQFIADIWDPMTVYPQWDNNGLIKCIRTYEVDKVTAIAMAIDFQEQGLEFEFYEPSDDSAKVKVVNYWRKKMVKNKPIIENAIMIAGQVVKPLTVQTKLKRIPIHVGAVGSPDRISPLWETRRGESFVYSNRDMYGYDNTILSLRATIVASQAYPNLVSQTRTGLPAVKSEDVKGYGEVIPLKLEDRLALLRNAITPEDAAVLEQAIRMQINKGTLPPAVYGSIPVELSGFAISQLLAAVRYKLGPYLNTLQSITSRVFSDFLFQYKNGRFPPITLSTENPQALKRGMTYIEEYKHDDIPEHTYVEVTIPITSQFDKTQAILNAVQAKNAGLLSRETLWEKELDIQDTEQERERIRQDQVEEDPFVLDMEIIEGLWAKVERLEVENKKRQADALKQYIFLKEQNLGMRKGIPVKPGGGVPPSQMPPEARESPDQRRAMLGMPPPGLSRRPQTSEERAQSKGRRGILVSPTGETLL